jgi:hypothetical protein
MMRCVVVRSMSAPVRVPLFRPVTLLTDRLRAWRALDGWWQPVLLLVLPFLLFLPGFRSGQPPFGGDVAVLDYPLLVLIKHELEQGQLPLWNNYAGGGYPLAPFSALIFYPPLWTLRFLSVDAALTVLDVVHFALAGLGAYALSSVTGGSRTARLIGALSFLLSGFLISHLFAGHLFELGVVAWMPWLFLAAHRLLERPTVRAALLLGMVGGLQILANGLSFLVFPLYPVLLVLVIGLLRHVRLHWTAGLRYSLLLLLSGVVALGIAAVLVLPFVQIVGHSIRSGGLDFAGASQISLPPAALLMLLSPDAVGNEVQNTYWLNQFAYGYWHEFALYIGLLPLLGTLVACRYQRQRPWVPLYSVLAVGGILLALGHYTPIYALAFAHLPLLDLVRVPSRWLLVSTLSAAVLSPVGIDWLVAQRIGAGALLRSLRLILLALLVPAVVILIVLQVIYMQGGHLAVQPAFSQTVDPALQRFVLFGGLLALVLACSADRLLRPSVTVGFLAAITLLDLWSNASGLVRFLDPGQLYQPTTISSLLGADQGTYRVLTIDRSMPNRQGMVTNDVYDAEDFAPVTLYPYWAVTHPWAFGGAYDISNADARDLFNCFDPRSAALASIGEVTMAAPSPSAVLCPGVAPSSVHLTFRTAVATQYWLLPNGTNWNPTPFVGVTYVYRNPDALLRAFLMPLSSTRVISSSLAQRLAVMSPQFNGRRTLVLDPQVSQAPLHLGWLQDFWAALLRPAASPLGALQKDQPRILNDRSDSMQVAVRASHPSYVVLTDAYYPGWQVYLDGHPVPLRRADYLLRAVQIPAGTHRLIFVYAPLSYLVGMVVTVLTGLAVAVALLVSLRRRPRRL